MGRQKDLAPHTHGSSGLVCRLRVHRRAGSYGCFSPRSVIAMQVWSKNGLLCYRWGRSWCCGPLKCTCESYGLGVAGRSLRHKEHFSLGLECQEMGSQCFGHSRVRVGASRAQGWDVAD